MTKQTKAAGTKRENQVKQLLIDDEWFAFRSPASLGVCDVFAVKCGERPRMVEVKANLDGGPYMNFRKADRIALKAAAKRACADAYLCWWPPRGEPRFIHADEWPPAV